jgi:hypothetical protein
MLLRNWSAILMLVAFAACADTDGSRRVSNGVESQPRPGSTDMTPQRKEIRPADRVSDGVPPYGSYVAP